MRVAVIGCGSIGARHALNAKSLGHDVMACDTDVDRAQCLANKLGYYRFAVAPLGVARDSDAVLICTPASTHVAVANELLDGGYRGPLFVEKPLALSADECRMFQIWPHQTTQVGYNLRFHPQFLALRTFLPDPTSGQFFLDCDSRTWPGQAYGPFLLEASHEIDLALVCGAPSKVDSVDGEDATNIWLGHWLVSLRDSIQTYHRQWSLLRRGAEASVFFYAPEELGDQMYRDEIAHFLTCAEAGSPTSVPFADGLRVLEVCDQVTAMTRQTA